MTALAPTPSFQIGRVISRLFGVLARNLASFLLLALVLVGLPSAVMALLEFAIRDGPSVGVSNYWIGFSTVAFVGGLITAIGNIVLQGAVIYTVVNDLADRPLSFGESLSTGLRFVLPLVGIGIVSTIAVGFGFVLFVVPGVLLALAWSVAAPAEVMERPGVFGAFSRSAELTRGHRGAILALYLIFFVVSFVVQAMVTGVQAMATGLALGVVSGGFKGLSSFPLAQTVATFIAQTLTAMVGAAGIASIYYELRVIKEGVGAKQLAAVFD
jgi:hypothetical protein